MPEFKEEMLGYGIVGALVLAFLGVLFGYKATDTTNSGGASPWNIPMKQAKFGNVGCGCGN